MSRDRCCIMTCVDPGESHCHACHLIPHKRGSEVSRSYVVRHLESALFLGPFQSDPNEEKSPCFSSEHDSIPPRMTGYFFAYIDALSFEMFDYT